MSADVWWVVVTCPRECPRPETTHCLGPLIAGRKARCWWCGRFMPMREAIPWDGD